MSKVNEVEKVKEVEETVVISGNVSYSVVKKQVDGKQRTTVKYSVESDIDNVSFIQGLKDIAKLLTS